MLDTKSIDGERKAHADNLLDSTRQKTLLKAGALQDAIFNSAYFSCIATDEKGVIQIFNVGAENMLGFAAADVINCITPADFSAPQELIVLDLSKVDAGMMTLELETVDLISLLSNSLSIVREKAAAQHIRLELDTGDALNAL